VKRKPFGVAVDSAGKVIAYGYEFQHELGEVHEVAEGQWRATVAGERRPLEPPVSEREIAIECLVRHWSFRGDYDIRID
jgi:hypothetical protein